jgi:Domain of unknown function (DUF4803)
MHRYGESNITDSMWSDFANSLVSRSIDHSVVNQMGKVYQIVVERPYLSSSQKPFLDYLVEYYERTKENQRCEMITSPQQTLIEFFRKMYAAETKTYILAAFAYQVKYALDPSNPPVSDDSDTAALEKYKSELELETDYFVSRTAKFVEMMQKYAEKLDRDFWVCNRKVNKHTTFQMNKFIYGYMDSEYDLNGACTQTCGDLKTERGLQKLSPGIGRRCVGMVKDCSSTGNKQFHYCYAKNPESSYMYEYIENDKIKKGAKEMCTEESNPFDSNPLQKVSDLH